MNNKQLSIPGLSVPEPKSKPPTQDKRTNEIASRVLALELEVALLGILMEKGDKNHA